MDWKNVKYFLCEQLGTAHKLDYEQDGFLFSNSSHWPSKFCRPCDENTYNDKKIK